MRTGRDSPPKRQAPCLLMSKSKSLINNIQKQKSRKKAGYKSELRPNRLILPS